RRGDGFLRETVEGFFVVHGDRRGVDFREYVLSELSTERRESRVDFLQARLFAFGELRTGAHEIDVIALDEPYRFGIEAERIARLVQGFDAREELRIQEDLVVVAGELRCVFRLERAPGVVRVGADEVEEN